MDTGEKTIFLGRRRYRQIMSRAGYIDDSGKAAEPTSRLNLVHGLFCFRTICHPLSECTYSRPAPTASDRYLWFRRRLINFYVSFSQCLKIAGSLSKLGRGRNTVGKREREGRERKKGRERDVRESGRCLQLTRNNFRRVQTARLNINIELAIKLRFCHFKPRFEVTVMRSDGPVEQRII